MFGHAGVEFVELSLSLLQCVYLPLPGPVFTQTCASIDAARQLSTRANWARSKARCLFFYNLLLQQTPFCGRRHLCKSVTNRIPIANLDF
jgi:hypothetical protein